MQWKPVTLSYATVLILVIFVDCTRAVSLEWWVDRGGQKEAVGRGFE